MAMSEPSCAKAEQPLSTKETNAAAVVISLIVAGSFVQSTSTAPSASAAASAAQVRQA